MSESPADYETRVQAMADALHEDCRLEWQAIAVVDPGRLVTQHGPDAHYGQAHDLVRRLATADPPAPTPPCYPACESEWSSCKADGRCYLRSHGYPAPKPEPPSAVAKGVRRVKAIEARRGTRMRRRQHLGHALVRDLLERARSRSALGVRLRCASTSDSNQFWRSIGFYCTGVTAGGKSRQRDINAWRTDIQPGLFEMAVEPSARAMDRRAFYASLRTPEGTGLLSRFAHPSRVRRTRRNAVAVEPLSE